MDFNKIYLLFSSWAYEFAPECSCTEHLCWILGAGLDGQVAHLLESNEFAKI